MGEILAKIQHQGSLFVCQSPYLQFGLCMTDPGLFGSQQQEVQLIFGQCCLEYIGKEKAVLAWRCDHEVIADDMHKQMTCVCRVEKTLAEECLDKCSQSVLEMEAGIGAIKAVDPHLCLLFDDKPAVDAQLG